MPQRVVGHHSRGPFVGGRFVERQLVVERSFAEAQCERAARHDRVGQFTNGCVELIGGDRAIDMLLSNFPAWILRRVLSFLKRRALA